MLLVYHLLLFLICKEFIVFACFENQENSVFFVTAFGKIFYDFVQITGVDGTLLNNALHPHNLIVYHEDDIPAIEGVCKVSMRTEFPWLDYELKNMNSGLNKYFKLATFFDPMVHNARKGIMKQGAILMLKVASINHAVNHVKDGSVVIWVDTDTTFRKPIPPDVISWLTKRDVTYMPLYLEKHQKNPFSSFDFSKKEDQQRALLAQWWRVESGTLAITVSNKTKEFTRRAIGMYRGGLYDIAVQCFNGSSLCKLERYGANVYGNDVFIWSLLLHADSYNDEFFHANLRHGWFATDGLALWGDPRYIYGHKYWPRYFKPAADADNLITNFHMGEYVFHHFGLHVKGALSIQFKHAHSVNESDSWRYITDPGEKSKSLFRFIGSF